LCDVKSVGLLEDPVFRGELEATGRPVRRAGFGDRVQSEPYRQLLMNARWLTGFRERPPDPDGERERMLSRPAAGGCTIGELLAWRAILGP
jgi:hypothetical protein